MERNGIHSFSLSSPCPPFPLLTLPTCPSHSTQRVQEMNVCAPGGKAAGQQQQGLTAANMPSVREAPAGRGYPCCNQKKKFFLKGKEERRKKRGKRIKKKKRSSSGTDLMFSPGASAAYLVWGMVVLCFFGA